MSDDQYVQRTIWSQPASQKPLRWKDDPERRRAYWRAYDAARKEKRREYLKNYAQKNTARRNAYYKEYYQSHKEEFREYIREYNKRPETIAKAKQWAENARNNPRKKQVAKAYRVKNKERLAKINKEWTVENREWVREYNRTRRAADPAIRLGINLRNRLNQALRRGGHKTKRGSAVRDLGCSVAEFMIYIASLFKPGMSWDNWGEWHIDHIKPLAAFDLTNREQFLAACNYTNLQPLWAAENLRKGKRIVEKEPPA